MVITELRHIEHQVSMTAGLKKAIDFLRRPDLVSLHDGKVEIDGDRVFAIIQRYETIQPDEPKFEYHQKYIDVQFIVAGEEMIGWAPIERMSITEAYEPEKDIAFGTIAREQWTPLLAPAGHAAVLWPEDAHAPKLAAGHTSPVMKIVVKVAAS